MQPRRLFLSGLIGVLLLAWVAAPSSAWAGEKQKSVIQLKLGKTEVLKVRGFTSVSSENPDVVGVSLKKDTVVFTPKRRGRAKVNFAMTKIKTSIKGSWTVVVK